MNRKDVMAHQTALQEWEQAEIRRSAAEAESADASTLIASEDNVARYVNPPADTLFHLNMLFICSAMSRDSRCWSTAPAGVRTQLY